MKKIYALLLVLNIFSIDIYSKDKLQLALIPYTNENKFEYNYLTLPQEISLRCLDSGEEGHNLDIALGTYYTLSYMEYRATILSGKYKLKYKNIFDQSIERIILVDSNNYRINICLDSLIDYPTDLWNELAETDTIKLVHIFAAHNYFESTGLIIYKFRNYFIAEIHAVNPSVNINEKMIEEYFNWSIDNRIIHRIVLTKSQMKEFSRFEDELRAISNGGTWTGTEYYHYTRGKFDIVRYDNKNQWNEFKFIRKKLFGE